MPNILGQRTVGDVLIIVTDGSPTGSISAPTGSLVMDTGNALLFQNTDGSTTWFQRGTNNVISTDWDSRLTTGTTGDLAQLDTTGAGYVWSSIANDWIRAEAYFAMISGGRTTALVDTIDGTETSGSLVTGSWAVVETGAGSVFSGTVAPFKLNIQASGSTSDTAYIERTPGTGSVLYFQGYTQLTYFTGTRNSKDIELRTADGARLMLNLQLTGSSNFITLADGSSATELTSSARFAQRDGSTAEFWLEMLNDPLSGSMVWYNHSAAPFLAISSASLPSAAGPLIRVGDDASTMSTALTIRSGTFLEAW